MCTDVSREESCLWNDLLCVCFCIVYVISGPVAVPIKWLISTCKFCPSFFAFILTLSDALKSLVIKAFALKQRLFLIYASVLNPHISILPHPNQV